VAGVDLPAGCGRPRPRLRPKGSRLRRGGSGGAQARDGVSVTVAEAWHPRRPPGTHRGADVCSGTALASLEKVGAVPPGRSTGSSAGRGRPRRRPEIPRRGQVVVCRVEKPQPLSHLADALEPRMRLSGAGTRRLGCICRVSPMGVWWARQPSRWLDHVPPFGGGERPENAGPAGHRVRRNDGGASLRPAIPP
jgi:hypothetical protein